MPTVEFMQLEIDQLKAENLLLDRERQEARSNSHYDRFLLYSVSRERDRLKDEIRDLQAEIRKLKGEPPIQKPSKEEKPKKIIPAKE